MGCCNNYNNKKVLIGGAWPYANGSLHIGHIAGLIGGDILARYYRLKGAQVVYVSGSDCHGTPISIKAEEEGVEPSAIAEKYHQEFVKTFEGFNFSYDLYTKTATDYHKDFVKKFFTKLYENNLLYPKKEKMAYCTKCERFLPDRYVCGTCYNCGSENAKGDECEACGTAIEVEKLLNKKCKICGQEPQIRETEHLFLKLSKFQDEINKFVESHSNDWRSNALGMSRRYLQEGLPDRAATRDLDWGIDVPVKGYEDKKIYVWIEAVLGYVSASAKVLEEKGVKWEDFWTKDTISYYAHGKDNIPFHSIILPCLLMGAGVEALPTQMVSTEFLNIEGKKISTSRNWAVWSTDYLSRYDADPLRYFLIVNGPETRDSDFSWREFVERNNGELLGAYGNLVNRTINMNLQYFGDKIIEHGEYNNDDLEMINKCKELFDSAGKKIESTEFREALKDIFEVVRNTNKYIDTQAPWVTVKEDKVRTAAIIKVSMDMILNLSSLLYPFIPETAKKALEFIGQEPCWCFRELEVGNKVSEPTILVKRLDKKVAEEESSRLGQK